MSKTPHKVPSPDLSRFCKSTFTLTFAVEVLGIDVWHDCNEGWLDLGPYVQGMKIQYQLYPGQTFDLDILIWPHAAKIWCGTQYGWVRTWQFLERRWLTFSIRHAFPVRVIDLRNHVATITPTAGLTAISANAKNDKNFEVFLPPLAFGERRYFAPIIEAEETLEAYITNLIWKAIEEYIPASCLDGLFDIPYAVKDVRHQDAALYFVQETILRSIEPEEIEEPIDVDEAKPKLDKLDSKIPKEKEKKKVEIAKAKFEVSLSGDTIISGTGRVVPFEVTGDKPLDLGEIIVLISSNNLPAQDDFPILFINVDSLTDIPIDHLKKVKISQLYTRWVFGDEVHKSKPQIVKNKSEMKFNDHHAVPMYSDAAQMIAPFLDDPYQIELRGIRLPPQVDVSRKFFGYEKGDRDFGSAVPTKTPNQDTDILIAVTKIDTRSLSKGVNTFIRAEYPLYPPTVSVVTLERERICTNDINAVRAPLTPDLVVQPGIVLEAQMTLEVSIGLVGCKPKKMALSYSRLFCLISDPEAIMAILREITVINELVLETSKKDDLLTGFALDTGDVVLLYIEGPRDGQILRIWDMTEDYYPHIKPVFSSSAKYSTRLYPELLLAAIQFNILKMFVPLTVLLACPAVYARPALPLPTRSAILKIGRLVARKMFVTPCRNEMPTTMELKSFRLELCVAPRPVPVTIAETPSNKLIQGVGDACRTSVQSVSRINWENK